MSGASALAAAKRRRAVPAEPTRPTPVQYKQNSNPNTNQLPKPPAPVATQGQSQPQNPLYVLLQHEQKLDNLEKSLNLMKITEKDKKEDLLTPDTLAYFKTQQELMSKEIQELKKIIIKVQTFSMETNLDLLKIKKTLKLIDSNDTTENIA
jgi:hypothetical protein